MAFAYVGIDSAGSDDIGVTTLTCTGTINVAAGDVIVAYLKWEDQAAPTVTWAGDSDDSTNQLTVGARSGTGGPYGCWAYRLAAQADAAFAFKVTWSAGVDYPRIIVYVFRPDADETVSLDGTYNLNEGSSGDPQSDDLTIAGTDSVAVGCYGEYAIGAISSPQIGDAAATGSYTMPSRWTTIWYKLAPASGAIHAQCASGGDPWQCGIIAFKSEGGGGDAITWTPHVHRTMVFA
jgi:hypothetical protein